MQCSTCGKPFSNSSTFCSICDPYALQAIPYLPSTSQKSRPAKPTEPILSTQPAAHANPLPPATTHTQPTRLPLLLLISALILTLLFFSAEIFFFPKAHASSSSAQSANQPIPAIVLRNPYPPYEGQLSYKDPLENNNVSARYNYQWTTDKDFALKYPAHCQFQQQSFHLILFSVNDKAYLYCPAINTDFSNFTYQVQMTMISGEYAGLTFRINQTGQYLFYLGQDNSYTLAFSTSAGSQTIIKQGLSGAIIPGFNKTNMLAVVAKDNNIDLYVNDQLLDSIKDTHLSSGSIGVLVLQKGSQRVEAAFSNVRVWS